MIFRSGFHAHKFGKSSDLVYNQLTTEHPLDLGRYLVANCFTSGYPNRTSGMTFDEISRRLSAPSASFFIVASLISCVSTSIGMSEYIYGSDIILTTSILVFRLQPNARSCWMQPRRLKIDGCKMNRFSVLFDQAKRKKRCAIQLLLQQRIFNSPG